MFNITFTLTKFGICLIFWFASTFLFRFMLGDKRDLYFTTNKAKIFLSQKGRIAQYISIGHPKNKQGLKLYLAFIGTLALELFIILLLPI